MTQIIRGLFLLVAIAFLARPADAGLPGGKCSSAEYLSALSTCGVDFVPAIADFVKNPFEAFQTKACKEGLLKKFIDCAEQVNRMCAYAIVPTSALSAAADVVCGNTEVFSDISTCSPNIEKLRTCAQALTITPGKPICSAISGLKKCMGEMLDSCSNNLKKVTGDIIDKISSEECGNEKVSGDKCSLLSYVISSGVCFGKLTSDLLSEKYPGFAKITQACRPNELKASLICQDRVDKRCGISIVNMRKAQASTAAACANIEAVGAMFQCVKPDYKSIITCVVGDESSSKSSACEFVKGAKKCYSTMFASCEQSVKSLTNGLYDLVVPSKCDNVPGATPCSLVSYVGTLGLCWSPPILAIAARSYKPLGTAGRCDKPTLMAGKSCHTGLDKTCEGSIVRPNPVDATFAAVCKDPQIFQKIVKCTTGASQKITACTLEKGGIGKAVTSTKDVCSRVNNINDCYLSGFKGSHCDASVEKLMSDVIDVGVPPTCVIQRDDPSKGSRLGQSLLYLASLAAILRYIF